MAGAQLRRSLAFVGWVDCRHRKVPGRKLAATKGQLIGCRFCLSLVNLWLELSERGAGCLVECRVLSQWRPVGGGWASRREDFEVGVEPGGFPGSVLSAVIRPGVREVGT